MSKIVINDVELEIDLMDADEMERFETYTNALVKAISVKEQYEGLSASAGMKLQCGLINDFFDNVFGEGASTEVFGDNSNLAIRLEGFGQCMKLSNMVKAETEKIMEKYTVPAGEGNRQQRRPMDFQKKKREVRRFEPTS